MGIAAVDEDVALLEMREDLLDRRPQPSRLIIIMMILGLRAR
jgi:hypothetical protein